MKQKCLILLNHTNSIVVERRKLWKLKKKVILMSFVLYYCLYKTNLLLVNLNRYIYKRKADFVHISLKFRKIIGSLVAVLILM